MAGNINQIETGIPINGVLNNFTVSSGISVQKGDFVECVDNVSLTIDPQIEDVIFQANKNYISLKTRIFLTDTKILYIYTDGVYGDNATYAVVCTIDSNGITQGVPLQLSTSSDSYVYWNSCRISENYCIINYVYYDSSNQEYLSKCRILNCTNPQLLVLSNAISIISSSSELNSSCLVKDGITVYENGAYPIMLVKCSNLDHTYSDIKGGSGLYMIRLYVNVSSSSIQILERVRLSKWHLSINSAIGIYDKNTQQLIIMYYNKSQSGVSASYITYYIYNGNLAVLTNARLQGINYDAEVTVYISSLYVNIDPILSIIHMVIFQMLKDGSKYVNYYYCCKINSGSVSLIQNEGSSGTLEGVATDNIARYGLDMICVGEDANIRYLIYSSSASMGSGPTFFTKLTVSSDSVVMLDTISISPVKVYYPIFNPLTGLSFALTYPHKSTGADDTSSLNYLEIFSEIHNKYIQEITAETPGGSVGIANEDGESDSVISVYTQPG